MEATHEDLAKKVARSIRFAIALVLLSVLAYMLWFGVFNPGQISTDPAVWGQLGDYVGGIANPLIAFLALYWLTQSVLLQRKELQETKDALKESAKAQVKQEEHAQRSVRVSALGAILVSRNSDVAAIRNEIERLNEALRGGVTFDRRGERINPRDVPAQVQLLNQRLDELLATRDEVSRNIQEELHRARESVQEPGAPTAAQ